MKLTYIYPPLFKSFYPMATRMITENLLRDEHLDVHFSDIPIRAYVSNIHQKTYERIMSKARSQFPPNIVSFLNQIYMANILFYVSMAHGYFNKQIFQDLENSLVMITCINFSDLIIVKDLLEKGKKVVVGGPLINIGFSASFIRQFLSKMGVDRHTLDRKLIIVSGNIDLSTELYRIIKDWKDTTITNNKYGTIYECERDFLQQYYDHSSSIPVHFGFNNSCWYGKCKFCTYKKLPKMDFLKDKEDSQVIDYIRRIMTRFNSRHIRFVDSYYRSIDPRVQNILSHIQDYDITTYTGIVLLKNKEYIGFVNKYVNCLLIGLESTSDFSLKHVNKGYTFTDINIALDNILRYLDRRVFLEISLILDLPCKDAADVRANYRNIARIKQTLEGEGFRLGLHMNILNLIPNMELLYGRKSVFRVSNGDTPMDLSSGKNYLIHLLKEAGMDRTSLLPQDTVLTDTQSPYDLHYGYVSSDRPILRYDIDGHLLPSDLNLIDEDTMKSILERRTRRSEQKPILQKI